MPRIVAEFAGDTTSLASEGQKAIGIGDKVQRAFSARKQIFEAETRLMQAIVKGETARVAAIQQEIALLKIREAREQAVAALARKISQDTRVSSAEAVRMAERRLQLEAAITRQQERAAGHAFGMPIVPGGRIAAGSGAGKTGARPAGKGGGESYSAGQNATDAYNIAQDFYFAGLAGISNNIPRLLQLLKGIPALITPVVASLGLFATSIAGFGYAIVRGRQILNEEDDAFSNYRKNKDEANRKLDLMNRKKAAEAAVKDGEADAQSAEDRAIASAAVAEQVRREIGLAAERRELERETARIKLEGIKDALERTKALAEFDKKAIKERAQEEAKAADEALERAIIHHDEAKKRVEYTKARLAMLPESAGLTPAEINERERLRLRLGGEARELKANKERVTEATRASDDARAALNMVPQRQASISASTDNAVLREAEEEARKATERIKGNIVNFFNQLERGLEAMARAAKERAEKAKNLQSYQQDTRVQELRGRGNDRRANRLQRKIDIERETEELTRNTNLTPEQAREEAERRINANDPTRQRRIRRAPRSETGDGGFTGLDDRRPWSLDRKTPWRMDNQRYTGLDGPGGETPDLKGKKPTIKGVGYKGPEAKRDEAPADSSGGGGPLITVALTLLRSIAADAADLRRKLDSRAFNR